MIISHKHKFIYFANGKCASSTIENALAKYNDDDRIEIVDLGYGKKGLWSKKRLNNGKHIKNLWGVKTEHVPPMLVREELGDVFDEYFKFSFVRNPWSWMASQYFWNFDDSPTILDSSHIRRVYEFLKRVRRGINGESKFQYSFLSDMHGEGEILVDYVGRVETFNKDFQYICEKIGVSASATKQKMNEKKSKKHYTEYYTAETRQLVAEKYAKDIEYFGYEFGE